MKISNYLKKDCVKCGTTLPLRVGHYKQFGNYCQPCCSERTEGGTSRKKLPTVTEYGILNDEIYNQLALAMEKEMETGYPPNLYG